ncbi:MAG: protein-export chaperone SecB [Candidatus Kryptoniota bacterium]
MKNDIAMLSSSVVPENTSWKMEFGFRQPIYFKSRKKYVVGMNVKLSLLPNPPESADVDKDFLLRADLGIEGMFSVEEGQIAKEIEEDIVRVHAPAILLPYARSTFTSLLSNAGFGSFILPLINIEEMARRAAEKPEIKVVD